MSDYFNDPQQGFADPGIYDPNNPNYIAQKINLQAEYNNLNKQGDLASQNYSWNNAKSLFSYNEQTSNAQYGLQQTGVERARADLTDKEVGYNKDYLNQKYGIDLADIGIKKGGVGRDVSTEQALQGLRLAGFGLDRQALGLQGQRIGLGEQEQRDKDLMSRRAAWNTQEDIYGAGNGLGAITSQDTKRHLGNNLSDLAFQLAAIGRSQADLGLQRSDLAISGNRINNQQSQTQLESTNKLGGLNDTLAQLGLQSQAAGIEHGHNIAMQDLTGEGAALQRQSADINAARYGSYLGPQGFYKQGYDLALQGNDINKKRDEQDIAYRRQQYGAQDLQS